MKWYDFIELLLIGLAVYLVEIISQADLDWWNTLLEIISKFIVGLYTLIRIGQWCYNANKKWKRKKTIKK